MKSIRSALVIAAASVVWSCGSAPAPEQQALRLVEEIERLAVAGSISGIADKVSDAYRDPEGRDKRAVLGLLTLALRNRDVFLWKHVQHLEAVAPDRVEVAVSVAAAAEPIRGPTSLRDIQADLLHFDAVVAEEDGGVWRVTSVVWRDARLEDLL